jgi:ABC-type lipoprotein release transport system permease subunit
VRYQYLLRLSFLYVWRSWRSTAVLGVMVSSAVAALVFLSSLAVGTNDAMIRNSVGLFSGHISGDDLPPDFSPRIPGIDGIEQILLRRQQAVWIGNADMMEAVLLLGVQPSDEKHMTSLWKKTAAGRYPEDGETAIYLSETIAKRLKVSVGDSVRVGRAPTVPVVELTLCGIYRTGISALDQGIAFCPRGAFPGDPDKTMAAVFLRSGVNPEAVTRELRSLPGHPDFRPWSQFMPDLKQLIDLNFVSMGIVMVLVFGIVSLSISCAFIIFILKNLKEHGIMKAMGILPSEATLLILTQVSMLTGLASLVGTAAGALVAVVMARVGIDLTALTSHNQYFVVSGVIYPRLTAYSLGLPPLLAVLFGKLAAVWPSVFVVRERAADILRSI